MNIMGAFAKRTNNLYQLIKMMLKMSIKLHINTIILQQTSLNYIDAKRVRPIWDL